MLDYKLPVLKKKISFKTLSNVLICIYVLSLIPMLILGFYNFPSADDFSMALQPHQDFVRTGNFFVAFFSALKKAHWIFYNYEGYYFSAFLTCLCPAIFSEKLYFLVPVIVISMLTFGVCYFYNALFVKTWKLDKHLTNVVSMTTLIMMIHFLKNEARSQAFYWWSGAVNYVFTFGMAFFWVGLLLRVLYDEDKRACKRHFIWACIWAFPMGGANYMTELELAILMVLMIFICVMHKFSKISVEGLGEVGLRYIKLIWIPAVIYLVGFVMSITAPGLSNRKAETEGFSPVKSVLLSLYGTFDVIIDKMARWETLVVLLFLIPIFWKLAGGLKGKLRHPVVFTVFAYGMVSSNMTPLYFGVGNFDSGRVIVLAWMEFVFFAIMTVFYITAWVRNIFEEKAASKEEKSFSWEASSAILVIAGILIFGSALCIVPSPHYYSVTSAIYDLASGNATQYKAENAERLSALKDDNNKDVVLKPYEVRPEMLFNQDIIVLSEDMLKEMKELKESKGYEAWEESDIEWINRAMARYYEKDSLTLSKGVTQ